MMPFEKCPKCKKLFKKGEELITEVQSDAGLFSGSARPIHIKCSKLWKLLQKHE